ncbi:MAG: hypothetical protein ACFLMY_04195 [Candidatus Brachytrichaceae bacterium NZ_4S206]|jgi:hypothetical protein
MTLDPECHHGNCVAVSYRHQHNDRKVAVAAYETNAYDLRAAFHDGWEPHYGAFFSSIGPGWNARFVGACNACQSSGGCPNTWGWWGTNRYYWCLQILVQQTGALEPSNDFHPLNIANLEANIKGDASAKRILTYSQAHQSFKVYGEADEVYVVATYAYRYSDVQSATAAANEVESQITPLSRTKVSTGLEGSSTRTTKVSFVGREGTLVT